MKQFQFYNIISDKVQSILPITSTIYADKEEYIYVLDFGEKLEKQIVKCFEIETGKEVWSYNVKYIGKYIDLFGEEKSGEIRNIIGVYKNNLIIQLKGGKLLSLDKSTGSLTNEVSGINYNMTKQESYKGDFLDPFLDAKKGFLYMIQGEIFKVVDLEKSEAVHAWDTRDLCESEYLFINDSVLCEHQLFFTARSKNGEVNTIGIFDIELRKIIWKHEFSLAKGVFLKELQVERQRMGVLDSNWRLHVFENNKKEI